MSDPLAVFFTQPLGVKRLTGRGPYGDQHAAEVTILCRLKHEQKLVRDSSGAEVVSVSSAAMAVGTADIPPGSLVQVPGDEAWRTVIAAARHIGGFDKSPDYYSIEIA
ncbi:hypothetical protein MYK68_15905 [Gordonia sp. PP30]|uniref:hypothetical protein n=1 Tax=Gordonia sp. PP30 TaxID=2935861 RepID=UPI001FFE7BFB|nr:hypothetical protein [Gordonia sp. PP30]UQE74195.1 hypothetical protein MYK68_15905 [Gordonia sp. PP30]